MDVTRREFLRIAGASTAGAVLFAGCAIPTRELLIQSPGQMPEDIVAGFDDWYASLCRHCPGTDGIIVRVMEGRAKKIEGNPDFPTNQGRSSARCQAGLQALYHPDRIQGPLRRQGDSFVSISWDEALNDLVAKLRERQGDPEKVVVLTEPLRGHLGKLVNLFALSYGARHMAFETLEETTVRTAIRQVFGQERLPDLDIANASFILSFGADFLGTWLSPVRFARGYGEFRQGEGRSRGYLVQVEPRMSMTAANADRWLPIRPGTEGILALSMAQVIISEDLAKNQAAVQALTGGQGQDWSPGFTLSEAAERTGVGVETIRDLARRFATQTPSLAIGGGSAGAHRNGLYNLKAVYSLNSLVDSVNRPGGLIFNPAFPLEDVPSTAAAAPYSQWRNLASSLGSDHLILVRGVNPVYGLPALVDFGGALRRAGYLVSFSSYMDETTALADLVLPEHTPLEDWGDDVPDPGPGYQTLGLQQPVVKPLFDTRSFADVLLTVAQEVGLEQGLPWSTFQEMLRDGARLLYDEGRHGMVQASTFEDFWRGLLMRGGWWDVQATSPETPITPPPLPTLISAPGPGSGDDYHLLPFPSLSLTDGRGANLLWLQATPDPLTTMVWKTWVEVNPSTAKELGLREGDVVLLEARSGRSIEVPVYPHPAAPPDVLSVPMGQGHTAYGQWAERRGSSVISLLEDLVDNDTETLAWAATRVRISPTGQRVRMTKMEGTVPAMEPASPNIIQLTRG